MIHKKHNITSFVSGRTKYIGIVLFTVF